MQCCIKGYINYLDSCTIDNYVESYHGDVVLIKLINEYVCDIMGCMNNTIDICGHASGCIYLTLQSIV